MGLPQVSLRRHGRVQFYAVTILADFSGGNSRSSNENAREDQRTGADMMLRAFTDGFSVCSDLPYFRISNVGHGVGVGIFEAEGCICERAESAVFVDVVAQDQMEAVSYTHLDVYKRQSKIPPAT